MPNQHQTMAAPSLAITLTVLLVSSLTIMANATIAPSLPGLAAHFSDVPNIETLAGLVLSLPALAIIFTASIFGFFADRIDRKILLVFAMLLYALGGASGLFTESITQLFLGRVLLGIGVGGTLTIATLLAAEFWTGKARGQFMGRQAAAMSAGGIMFAIAGGALAEVSWRGPFLIYLLAIPFAVVVWFVLPKRQVETRDLSVKKAPLDWRVIAPIGALAFFTMTMFYIIPTRLPFLLVEMGINSPSASGFAIAAVTLTSILSSLSFARLRDYLNPIALFGCSFMLMGLAFVTIATASGMTQIIFGALLLGLGLGATMPNQQSWLISKVSEATRGRASGLLTTFIFAGQLASPLLAGSLAYALPLDGVFGLFAVVLFCVGITLFAIGHFKRHS